ncbi:MAG: hypothetical protein DMD96_09365 [Candidatus Rokuibacteriota bacterium]|nr:MAG: hypothetical protein DMD96_09365 [Candidatus Rokubacteria bacterium]
MIVVSLLLLGVGSIGAAYVQSLWHVCVTTGFFMALGAGGVSMTTGSTIAARWFETRRGVAIGLTAGGMSAGQLVMVPLAMALTLWFGWRTSYDARHGQDDPRDLPGLPGPRSSSDPA